MQSGQVRFINGFEGKPQGDETYSEAQLSKRGMVGIYKREGDKDFQTISSRDDSLEVFIPKLKL